ncbi:MAG: hypothetical protein H6713_31365 [Myxococcales bacterium]|nr:hypothetical protein [Myxococcales bacterium]
MLIFAVAACSGAGAPQGAGAKPTAEAKATESCGESYSAQRQQQMEAMCALEGALSGAGLAPAPDGLSTRAPSEAIPVEITRDGVTLGSAPVDPTAVASAWTRESGRVQEMARLTGRTVADGWALTVHADVDAGDVAVVLDQLSSVGAVTGELRFTAPLAEPAPAPPDPAFHKELVDELAPLDPARRASALATRIPPIIEGCASVTKVFSAIAVAPADQRCELMAAGFADALRECSCPPWADKLMTFVHIMTVGVEPPVGRLVALPVQLGAGAEDQEADSEDTWSQLATRLSPGARWPLRLSPR